MTTFCSSGHALCCWLHHVIHSAMLNAYHSATLSQLQECPVSLQFTLPDVVIISIATPHHWALYFQGSGVPVSCCGTWSGSMQKVYIALKELQAVALTLHKVAFDCLVGWLPYIWTILLLKLTYIIREVQDLLFIPD